jgi:DNA repair exonuclease SbcCD nuclease subunit
MPYYKDKDKFLKDCVDLFSKGCENTLIAHQNFTIPLFGDMIDCGKIPQKRIISGHVHDHGSGNEKVFYTDTPMWLTATDCNKDKGIWIVEFDELKNITESKFVSTKDIVTPIVKYLLNEGDSEDFVFNPNSKNYLELVGSTAWIVQMKKKYKGLAQIKARPSDRKNVDINKDKAFTMFEFLDASFKPIDGVGKEDIRQYLKEVLSV